MAKKLWGGRFSKPTDPLVEKFTRSIQYDYKLALYDVLGSMLHVEILRECGDKYLTKPEYSSLMKALDSIYEKVKANKFKFDDTCEDVHTCIQNELYKKVGDLALKLHTARSRNDQVVFATKMYSQTVLLKLAYEISGLRLELAALSKNNSEIIIPGFTHLQHAQPVYLKDYLQAYIDMLIRDAERLVFIEKNMKITMGAGALAGTPVDAAKYNRKTSEILKDKSEFLARLNLCATSNSLDTVSDRDFVIEIISALAMLAMHLSRLAEDLILWSTKEFDFVELDDAFCTGSSLMPQKKNPDVLELVRGYAGRLNGNLVSVLTMMKGLPLTYNRDMQLDKEPLFNSFEIVSAELEVLAGLVKTLKFKKNSIAAHLKDESLYATDLVYYLVDKKVPFKQAHTIVGKLVLYSLAHGIEIKEMPENILHEFSEAFVKKEIVKLFDPLVSVRSKKSISRKK